MRWSVAACLTGWVLAVGPLTAGERVDYLREVKPVLAARCYACHGALKQRSGLRLDTVALMRRGGDNGPIIVAGKGADSLLVARISASHGLRRMPPKDAGEPLKPALIERIKVWIDQGAAAPADEKPEADPGDHWAFRRPVRPPVPQVRNTGWVRNPVDAFIAAEQEKHGLVPQAPADKRILLRRVYLDLVGLPPTREELAAFVADPSPDAYGKVVDRLLASKQYGERWGRHWMDVWRYTDWWGLGEEVRNSQKHMWHWRDWIIESLNADKAYDQMVREMLAADELYPNDLDRLRASGFLARTYFKFNRTTWLDDTVEHTSKAFLGLTMNCAKCHDHKYDPITQNDYYRLRAVFEPYQVRTDELPGRADLEKDGLPRVFDCNLDAPTYLFIRGDEKQPAKDRPMKPGVPRFLSAGDLHVQPVALPAEARQPGLRPFVLENHLREAEEKIAAAREAVSVAKKTLAAVEAARRQDPVATAVSPTPRPLLRDDFAAAKPDWWEMREGRWKYEAGRLVQQQDGDVRAVLRAKGAPPSDFEARFQFTITGGRQWRSVGITFDAADGNEVLVYVSAFAGGPKLQIAYKQGGNYVYPPGAAQPHPVQLNKPQDLTIRVRGSLLNATVGAGPPLVYRLPLPRRRGALELITYDAQAAFSRFELAPLPASVQLVETGAGPGSAATVEQARAALVLAEKELAAVELQPSVVRARAAADRARVQNPPAVAKAAARDAAQVEARAAVVRAEGELARAELNLTRSAGAQRAEAEKKVVAARDGVNKARKALAAPGETYTPLRGSLKTVENNLETEASRSKPYPATSTGRRSALALWLTDSRNPLTARVAVNHLWARHFGRPLVATVFDFGRKGTRPTHPELLDYLAVELMETHWSMKHLHRLMVTSNTYRLGSGSAGAAARAADPENRYYWRMNPVRMEAEVIRDSLLSLSGDLDPTVGGPAVDPANQEFSHRRSLYFFHSHNDHHRFLTVFDDANVLECYRRTESIVPQQALALSNSTITLTAAARTAAHLTRDLGKVSDKEFARAAFESLLACRPSADERAECERALVRLTKRGQETKQPDPVLRARTVLVHALLNHNDFITIR